MVKKFSHCRGTQTFSAVPKNTPLAKVRLPSLTEEKVLS